MKIYFFGTPAFAIPCLEMLANSKDFNIQAVVTQPDRPGDRGKITPPPIKTEAEKLKLTVLQPEKIDKTLIERIEKDSPAAIIVVAYGGLIPKSLLAIPKYGCINVHPSMLPIYRGASPIQEALLNGDPETGVSIMKMDEELDHGGIYLIKRVGIDPTDNHETLSKKLSEIAGPLLHLALCDIKDGTLKPIPQNNSKATFCRKIEKKDGEIDWNKSSQEILNQIRALNPWPSTYTTIKGKKIKILEAKKIQKTHENPAGSIEILDKTSFGLHSKDGLLVPLKIQLEGKPPCTTKEFMNGNSKLLEN